MTHSCDTYADNLMRVISGGVPQKPGASGSEKMKWMEKNCDQLRMLMMKEPRGYPARCSYIVLPTSHPTGELAMNMDFRHQSILGIALLDDGSRKSSFTGGRPLCR